MEHYRVAVSALAERDLRDIVRYISAQFSAPMTAAKMMDAIEDALAGVADMPQKFPAVTDERLASMGYSKLVVKNYMVFFTTNEPSKVVDIVRILYAKRDWMRIL